MSEGGSHRVFKKVAVDILKEKGFCASEIKEEYVLEYIEDGRTKYIIDIVGMKNNYKMAIECGSVEYSKLINLRKVFDDVIVVNVEKVVELYDYWRSEYIFETKKLRDEVERLNTEIGSWQRKMEYIRTTETGEMMSLKKEHFLLKKDVIELEKKLRVYQKVMRESWEATKEQY